MINGKKVLMPNADERYVAETEDERKYREIELESIRQLEEDEAKMAEDKKAFASTNDEKAGGISLQVGSAEYREMIYDRQGMDEFEQEKAELERSGKRKANDYQKDDIWHGKRAEKLASERVKAKLEREADEDGRLTTAERKVSHEVRKADLVDDVTHVMTAHALATETKSDDAKLRSELPDLLEEGVYNDAETEDDFYPGSRTLNKYL